ncbi:MAG: DUF5667 domain-containing protein [Chloroflexota bacterium]
MNPENHIDPRLAAMLEELKDVSPRNPKAVARGRAYFLAQGATMRQAVSGREHQRPIGWNTLFRKERRLMNAFVSVILSLVLLLGGGAGTVYAAQDAMPTNLLYGIKTFSEDVRLWFNHDPQIEIDMLLQMFQTRVEEITALTAMDINPPAHVIERLNLHIEQALHVAANMNDSAMPSALLQIRTTLQTQEQAIIRLKVQGLSGTAQVFLHLRTMCENHIRLVELGLTDPQGFRHIIREENQDEFPGTPGPGYGPGPSPSETPGNENGHGDDTHNGEGMGPGNGNQTPDDQGLGPVDTSTPGNGGMGPSGTGGTSQPGNGGMGPSGTGGTPQPGSGGMESSGTPTPGSHGSGNKQDKP